MPITIGEKRKLLRRAVCAITERRIFSFAIVTDFRCLTSEVFSYFFFVLVYLEFSSANNNRMDCNEKRYIVRIIRYVHTYLPA